MKDRNPLQLYIEMSKCKEIAHCYLKLNLKAGHTHADLSNYLLELATNHVFNSHKYAICRSGGKPVKALNRLK